MSIRLTADWGKIITAALCVFMLTAQAKAETETAPAEATDSIELALPPGDDVDSEPLPPPRPRYYSEAPAVGHSFGAALGVGSIYGEIEDPYRDDSDSPSTFDVSFLYRYRFIRYIALAADMQFIIGSTDYNHNGVENDVVINRYGNLNLSLIPISLGLVISPGLLSFDPYISGGGVFAYWDARQDWVTTRDGTERKGYYSQESGSSYGYYIAAGIKLKPRKYYSYFIEFRYNGLQEQDVLDYEDFDLSNFMVNIGFTFDYIEESKPRY